MISFHIISAFNDLFPYDFLSHPQLFPPVGSLGYDNDFRTNDLFPYDFHQPSPAAYAAFFASGEKIGPDKPSLGPPNRGPGGVGLGGVGCIADHNGFILLMLYPSNNFRTIAHPVVLRFLPYRQTLFAVLSE